MVKGFPTYTKAARSGEAGLDLVSRVVHEDYGWIFRRVHQEHDFGIDAQVDVVLEDGAVTGQILAMQIKHGASFFQEKNQWGYVYRGEIKHLNYLANYPTPVLIVLCHPSGSSYWINFKIEETQKAGVNWKITVPFENLLKGSKARIAELLPPPGDHLAKLEEFWAMNNLIGDVGHIHFIIDKSQVVALDTHAPRAFFDRLQVSRQVALSAQGKVEISFHGYDNDRRELFEIPEVRRYAKVLDAALQEIFFFARTSPESATLKALALCQVSVEVVKRSSNLATKHYLDFDSVELGKFLERHWPAFNELTDWVGMSIDENRKISCEVALIFGFEIPDEDGE